MSSEASSARTFAGLIDVLDRADGVLAGQRPRPRRSSVHRSPHSSIRIVPLRSVRPAPMARRAPGAPVVPAARTAVAVAPRTRIRGFTSRMAMWGAGADGEYLAWRCPPPCAVAGTVPPRPSRVRGFLRRVALWGAGPSGEYLAWGSASSMPSLRVPSRGHDDGPVVLREMPSTPTIQPAATSPAAAQPPRGPASSAGTRGMPPVPRGAVAVPGRRPLGPPERSRATGWPSPASRSTSTTGLVRTRGDPLSWPARGSPP
jgi:hypothetical protein